MSAEYYDAPEVEEIARAIIPSWHAHLEKASLRFLFTTGKRKKHDRVVLGSAQTTSSLIKYFSARDGEDGSPAVRAADFIVIITVDEWRPLSAAHRRALVDHELTHCTRKFNSKTGLWSWAIRAHDVEEFREVIRRHGLWRADLRLMAEAFGQLPMEFPGAGEDQSEVDDAPPLNLRDMEVCLGSALELSSHAWATLEREKRVPHTEVWPPSADDTIAQSAEYYVAAMIRTVKDAYDRVASAMDIAEPEEEQP